MQKIILNKVVAFARWHKLQLFSYLLQKILRLTASVVMVLILPAPGAKRVGRYTMQSYQKSNRSLSSGANRL